MAANNEVKCAIGHCPNLARPGGRTCSPTCAKLWARTYRYTDPVEQEKHRIQQAKTILRSREKYSEVRIRWAEKVLASC